MTNTSTSPRQPVGPVQGLVRDLVLVLVSGGLFAVMATTTLRATPHDPWIVPLLVVPVLCLVASLRRLQQSNWGVAGAGLLLLLTMSHPLMLYAISSEPRALGAIAALVLAAIAVLDILKKPDAETRIHLGLFLAPLALVEGGWPILLPLAFLSPLTEPRARAEIHVAIALLLVALVPALIVLCAASALQLVEPGGSPAGLLQAMSTPFARRAAFDTSALWALAVTSLPLLVFMLFALREPGNRKGAAVVVMFPLLTAGVCGAFEINLSTSTASLLAPLLVFLWSSGRQWSAPMRIALCVAMAASALTAWQSDLLWSGSSWRERQMGQSSGHLSQACPRIGGCPAPLLRPTLPLS